MKKMRAVMIVALAGLTGLLAGCGPVSSLYPLFTDSDLIFDPRLLGDWAEKGPDHGRLRFEQAGPKLYRVTNIEPDAKGGPATETSYEVHLVRLGDYRFLDVAPLQMTATGDSRQLGSWETGTQSGVMQIADGFYMELRAADPSDSHSQAEARLRRGHWIFKAEGNGTSLKLAALDDDWLKDTIDQGGIAISHTFVDPDKKEIVISAASEDLQQLVLKHAADENAFPETAIFRKMK